MSYDPLQVSVKQGAFSSNAKGLWQPTLERTAIPVLRAKLPEMMARVREVFGKTAVREYRAASVLITGPAYAQVTTIKMHDFKGATPVVLGYDFRGVGHILFATGSFLEASMAVRMMKNPIESKVTRTRTETDRVLADVAKAIYYGEYKWPSLFDAELPVPPTGSRWMRGFMAEVFTLSILSAQITERQVQLYINRNYKGPKQ